DARCHGCAPARGSRPPEYILLAPDRGADSSRFNRLVLWLAQLARRHVSISVARGGRLAARLPDRGGLRPPSLDAILGGTCPDREDGQITDAPDGVGYRHPGRAAPPDRGERARQAVERRSR